MKKVILLLFIGSLSFSSYAQIDFGVFAGPQYTGAAYQIDNKKQEVEFKPGLQIGALWRIPFENRLNFVPSAFYSLKGYKVDFDGISYPPGEEAINNNTTIHTIEVAGLLQYNFSENPSHFFIKAGPSFEFIAKAKEKFERPDGSVIERDMPLSFTEYGRWGINVLGQLGYESENGLFVFGQYSLGTGNMSNTLTSTKINFRGYNISIGKYISRRTVKTQKRF